MVERAAVALIEGQLFLLPLQPMYPRGELDSTRGKIRRLIYGVMLDGMGLGQALDGSEEAEVHDADR